MNKSFTTALFAAAVAAFASDASAATVLFSGTTVGGALWNRPIAGNPTTSLSGVGTAVPFQATPFTVDISGTYSFSAAATAPAGWDNYSFIYTAPFNPLSPLANVIIGNDDFGGIGTTAFDNVPLTAGTNYVYIQTGYSNTDSGTYALTVTGIGTFLPNTTAVVPEPGAAMASLLSGCAGSVLVLRRRRRVCA